VDDCVGVEVSVVLVDFVCLVVFFDEEVEFFGFRYRNFWMEV